MSRITILLADVPLMLGDIMATLAVEPRLQIVAQVGPDSDLDEVVRRTGADVVLMSERMDPTVTRSEFFLRHPGVRLITISVGGDRLRLRGRASEDVVLTDVSPQDLLTAILG